MIVRRSEFQRIAAVLAFVCVLCTEGRSWAASQDDLARKASWDIPLGDAVRENFLEWLASQAIDDSLKDQIQQRWSATEQLRPDQVLQQLVESLAAVDARVKELDELCRHPRPAYELPEITVVNDPGLPSWITANLRLFYGTWLANQQLFDETSQQLSELSPADVVDPASLLFYQSVAAHRRLEKDRCLTTLVKLLENEDRLPQRYRVVARLMQADLEPLRPDSLDEISRLMDSIQVRLGHGRAGKQVRTEEGDVIAKLDKLIKKLEDQANAMGAGSSGGGSNAPAAPMEDSMPGGGTGPGNVDPKQLGSRTDWGNLPPKQREEALQQLGKDLPSHYRDVIEEYFRKLARDQKQP
jgi:hypothetical protein